MKSLFSTLEQYFQKAERTLPSSVSILKVIREWPFFKSGDRYSFFLTIGHIFFWVSEETEKLSPLQILYNKLEKYLSLSVYKNISFIQRKVIAISSKKESDY